MFDRAATIAISASRAVAAACRIWTPPRMMPLLPAVGPWSGVSAVSPSTITMRVDVDAEFLGRHLRDRDAQSLAQVDLAARRSSPMPSALTATKPSTSLVSSVLPSAAFGTRLPLRMARAREA